MVRNDWGPDNPVEEHIHRKSQAPISDKTNLGSNNHWTFILGTLCTLFGNL